MDEARPRRATRASHAPLPRHWELTRISGATLRMHDPSRKTPSCLTCDYAFARGEPPAEFMVCKPIARHGMAICNALCARCAAHPHALERAIAVYRRDILHDLAVVAFADIGHRRRQ